MPSWEDGSDKRLAEYRGETVDDGPGFWWCRECGAGPDLPHLDGCTQEDPEKR